MRLSKRQKMIKQKIKSSYIRVGDFVRYVGVPRSLSGSYVGGYTIVYDILGTRHKIHYNDLFFLVEKQGQFYLLLLNNAIFKFRKDMKLFEKYSI